VVFVCENNIYGFSTHYRRTMLIQNIFERAAAYGIPGAAVDGMDVLAVYEAAEEAIGRARAGGGPTLLECKTYRYMGHSRFEPGTYRSKEEVAEWMKRDPILALRRTLVETMSVAAADLELIEQEIEEEIEESVRFAEGSPEPAPGAWREYIYAP
jgi:TPP-dependent pyruvate/acetoin dehydrogenase alpha subunit